MKKKILYSIIFLSNFYTFFNKCYAQNVGIGTSSPTEKLHVNGNLRVENLSSPDSNVVLSDVNGKLINLSSGTSGQVLTSQGPGRAPDWTTPKTGNIFVQSLTGNPSVTCSNSSAGTLSLLTHNFIPTHDTVLFTFTAQGRLTSTSALPAQPHPYIFRIVVNSVTYRQFYQNIVHNGSGSVTTAFVPISVSLPIPVTPNVNNTITIQVLTFLTSGGTYTLTFDTSTFTQFANSIIYDFPTN